MSAKAVILLATLKKKERSNTETLCEFLIERAKKSGVDFEIIKLVDHDIHAGTYFDMGDGDEWPAILDKILAAGIVVFASPIWWGGHSSEMQKAIERLDEIHDEILAGKKSRLDGKVAGIVITGDSDGAQNIIASIANFCNALGLVLPPYATLSVLWEGQAKGKTRSREELMKKYEKDYAKTTDTMIHQLLRFAK